MARHEDPLVGQIERDALDEDVSVATALRKCISLGGKSKSERLRDWATRELKGYDAEDDLPEYRIVSAPILIDGISGNVRFKRQQFPPMGLPDVAQKEISERVRLRDGVGGIEALTRQAEINLQPPMASDLVMYMNATRNNPYQIIERLYWGISHAAIEGVLDQIRTSLTQLVAELRASMAADEEVPSAEAANQAVSVVVTGKRARVNVAAAHAGGTGAVATATGASELQTQEDSGFWTRSRKIGAFIVGSAGVAGAVVATLQFLS
jgi:hypothetical protein